jgi:hypothetical protein
LIEPASDFGRSQGPTNYFSIERKNTGMATAADATTLRRSGGVERSDVPFSLPRRLRFDALFALARRRELGPMRREEMKQLELQHRSDLCRIALVEGPEQLERALIIAMWQDPSVKTSDAAENPDILPRSTIAANNASTHAPEAVATSAAAPASAIATDVTTSIPPSPPIKPSCSTHGDAADGAGPPQLGAGDSASVVVTAAAAAAAVLSASVQRAHLAHLTLDAIGSVEPLVRQSLFDEENAARETLQLRRLVMIMEMQHRAAAAAAADVRASAVTVAPASAAAPADGATAAVLGRAVTMLEQSHRDAIAAAALVAASHLGHDMIQSAESAHREVMTTAAAAVAFALAIPAEDEDRLLPGDGGSTARPHSSARAINDAATDTMGGDAPPHDLEATKRFLSYDDVSSGGAGTCSDVEWDEHSSVSSTASIRPDRTAWV